MKHDLSLSAYAAEGDWHLLVSRYVLCAPWTRNKRVLDLVCGRGIGCEIFRRAGADHVIGVDTRDEVIHWASQHLARSGLSFHNLQRGSQLPFSDEAFEVVVALNPNRGFGDLHFREIRRVLSRDGILVLAEQSGQPRTLQPVLPFFDRSPLGEAVPPADRMVLHSLFGEPVEVIESPLLAMHYDVEGSAADPLGWPNPDQTILRGEEHLKQPLARVSVFGRERAEVFQTFVELPYAVVASRVDETIQQATSEHESVRHDLTFLRSELLERTARVEQLERQLALAREEAASALISGSDLDSALLTGWRQRDAIQKTPPLENDTREAYIQELWQSACDWKEYAERLQREVADQGDIISEREGELSRQLEHLGAALRSEQTEKEELANRLPALKDQVTRLDSQSRERDRYLNDLKAALDEREAKLDQFTQEMEQSLETMHLTKRELDRAKESLSGFEAKKEEVKKETVSLDEAVRTKSARIQTLEREAVGNNVKIASLEKENGRLLKAKAQVDRQVAALKKELEALASRAESARDKETPEPPPETKSSTDTTKDASETVTTVPAAEIIKQKQPERRKAAKTATSDAPSQPELALEDAPRKRQRSRKRRQPNTLEDTASNADTPPKEPLARSEAPAKKRSTKTADAPEAPKKRTRKKESEEPLDEKRAQGEMDAGKGPDESEDKNSPKRKRKTRADAAGEKKSAKKAEQDDAGSKKNPAEKKGKASRRKPRAKTTKKTDDDAKKGAASKKSDPETKPAPARRKRARTKKESS